jgi:hypothetical protein
MGTRIGRSGMGRLFKEKALASDELAWAFFIFLS